MTRIPYVAIEKLTGRSLALVTKAPINVVRMLAGASPPVFEAFSGFSASFYTSDPIPPDLREVAILRVGSIAGSDYMTWQHHAIAEDLGVNAAQIAAVRSGGQHPDTLSPIYQAVLDFVDDVVINVSASDATLIEVRRFLSDRQTIDLILLTGLYMTMARLLETAGVERDQHQIDAGYIQSIFS